jgi:hypothetical protein
LTNNLDMQAPIISHPQAFIEFKNKVYFSADKMIYRTDGTVEGTELFSELQVDNNNTGGDLREKFYVWKDWLYFGGLNADNQGWIYRTDGNPNGIEQVRQGMNGIDIMYFSEFVSTNQYILLKAPASISNSFSHRLYITDENNNTVGSLEAEAPTDYGFDNGYSPGSMYIINNKLVFRAKANEGVGLWVADVSDITTSTVELDEKKFSLFPNPANDYIQIESTEIESVTADLVIYDMLGRIVFTKQDVLNQTINIGHLPEGAFVLKLVNEAQNFQSKKLIIRKK